MAPTRILTVNLPRLLNGVLSAIVAGHEGMDVIEEADASDVVAAVQEHQANVVVICTNEGRGDPMFVLLKKELPELRIVTIDCEGRRATMYEAGAADREANEVSAKVLVDLLRGMPR